MRHQKLKRKWRSGGKEEELYILTQEDKVVIMGPSYKQCPADDNLAHLQSRLCSLCLTLKCGT